MKRDLLTSLAAERDVTNAVALTHNLDFLFVQQIVLPGLRACGHPKLTIFADAGCAAESFAQQAPLLDRLGRRFRVVPMAMAPGFRFHPKALLLSGTERASLWVGSGNLTFGGWRENAEVWTRYGTDSDGTAAFTAFRTYLGEILARVRLPGLVQDEVAEAFDPATRPWARELAPAAGLLGKAGVGSALIDRMAAALGGAPVRRLVVCCPYFDDEAEALQVLAVRFGVPEVEVLVQSGRSGLTPAAAGRLPSSFRLRSTAFQHVSTQGQVRTPFLHAKLYAFFRDQDVLVFSGSANASRAALLLPGSAGNAELLAVQAMPAADFEASFLVDLAPCDAAPSLASTLPEPAPPAAQDLPRVLAARHEAGSLDLGWSLPRGAVAAQVEVDGQRHALARANDTEGSLPLFSAPRRVILVARRGDAELCSPPFWVDCEEALQASARARGIEESLQAYSRADTWGVEGWTEVMEALFRNLQYMPQRAGSGSTSGSDQERIAAPTLVSFDEVFGDGRRMADLARSLEGAGFGSREEGFQALLLRWFRGPSDGAPEPAADEVEPGEEETIEEETTGEGSSSGQEAPLVPDPIPEHARAAALPERQRERVRRILADVEQRFVSSDYLGGRRPSELGADIQIVSAMLRNALAMGWIGAEDFFRVTRSVFGALFLQKHPRGRGWLGVRVADDPERFPAALGSARTSAALAAWLMAVPPETRSVRHALFSLAGAIAVGRYPWLWAGVGVEPVARELQAILHLSPVPGHDPAEPYGVWWDRLLRRGRSLLAFERAVGSMPLRELQAAIRRDRLEPGDVLWQGTRGFCVVTEACRRARGFKPSVLVLEDAAEPVRFVAEATVPLRDLLELPQLPRSAGFGEEERAEIRTLLDGIAAGFRAER